MMALRICLPKKFSKTGLSVMKYSRLSYALIAVLLCLLNAGCGSDVYEKDAKSFDAASLRMIQDKTGLHLPDGSKGLHIIVRERDNLTFAACIEIPVSGLETLKEELSRKKSRDGEILKGLVAPLSWWNPSDGVVLEKLFVKGMDGIEVFLCNRDDRWLLFVYFVSV